MKTEKTNPVVLIQAQNHLIVSYKKKKIFYYKVIKFERIL